MFSELGSTRTRVLFVGEKEFQKEHGFLNWERIKSAEIKLGSPEE